MKKAILNSVIFTGLMLAFALTGLAQAGEIKLQQDCPPNPDYCCTYVWSKEFSKHLNANGMKVELYPVGALGSDAEVLDQVSQGLLEISCSPLGKAGQLDDTIWGFWVPYLFDDIEHIDRVINNTDIMSKINAGLTKKGVRLVSLVVLGGNNGLHNTKRTIKTPADMKGLRMRALDKKQAKWFEAWGASSVIVPWPEIYNALQTGLADGYINPPLSPVMGKQTDILRYYSDIQSNYPFRIILCSEKWYQSLSDKERNIFEEGVKKANTVNRAWQVEVHQKALNDLKKAGVEIYFPTPEERAAFAKLIRPIYNELMTPEVADIFKKAAKMYR
jgi:TRAP-type C4-dicarboxylate transport system substrate-binding protein